MAVHDIWLKFFWLFSMPKKKREIQRTSKDKAVREARMKYYLGASL